MRTIKGLLIGGVRKYRTFGITQITYAVVWIKPHFSLWIMDLSVTLHQTNMFPNSFLFVLESSLTWEQDVA